MIVECDRIFLGCTRMSKSVPTKRGLQREVERKAFNAVYANDELYARHIRANCNLDPNKGYEFTIFDTLPEGWSVEMTYGGRHGLRGKYDNESESMWCEFGRPYRNAYPGDTARNPEYKQALVRRK